MCLWRYKCFTGKDWLNSQSLHKKLISEYTIFSEYLDKAIFIYNLSISNYIIDRL